jgi:hypothetical protein
VLPERTVGSSFGDGGFGGKGAEGKEVPPAVVGLFASTSLPSSVVGLFASTWLRRFATIRELVLGGFVGVKDCFLSSFFSSLELAASAPASFAAFRASWSSLVKPLM